MISSWTKLKLFFLSKKGIVALLILSIILLPALYFTLLNQSEIAQKDAIKRVTNSANKIWELTLLLDTKTEAVSLKEINITDGIAPASPFEDTPYLAQVLDDKSNILFKTHFSLIQDIAYNSYFAPNISSEEARVTPPKIGPTMQTPLALPYFPQAKTIKILKNDREILNISPPKLTSFSLFSPVFAETPASNCKKLYVVFIAEGYTDFIKFKQDAKAAQDSILSVEPFSRYKDRIDFSKIENEQSLGCVEGNRFKSSCINSDSTKGKVLEIKKNKLPDLPFSANYTKLVILVDADREQADTGSFIDGVAQVGGWLAVIPTRLSAEIASGAYIHEIGGHLIGHLQDRYVYNITSDEERKVREGNIKETSSNCSLNSEGEEFWRQARPVAAGGKNAYPKCVLDTAFGPAEQTCAIPGTTIKNRGNPDSVMSAVECGGKNFDKVEQWYLENNILKKYNSCSAPAANPAPAEQSQPDQNPQGAGKLICYPKGGISKRYDSDTLIVENKMNEEVELLLQQNYCDYKGRPQQDGDPDCEEFAGYKTDKIKPNEKKSYQMTKMLTCKNNMIAVKQVISKQPNQGCYRDDKNEPWRGGVAFAVQSKPGTTGTACSPLPASGENLSDSIAANLEGAVNTTTPAGPAAPGPAGAASPPITCRQDPNCPPIQKGLHLCQLICSP